MGQLSHCGESGGVDRETVEDWKKRISEICAGYEPKNIFNADETGLLYRALPTRSLLPKGDLSASAGVKTDKIRITVLVVLSATGEKLFKT